MSSNKINKKSIARIAAIQAIYQHMLRNNDNIDDIIENVLSFYRNDTSMTDSPIKISLTISHFKMLVKLVFENIDKIDEIISNNLVNDKNQNHIPILLQALLRSGICELLFFPDIPAKVVINEYTDIANDMLNDHEIGFVNSILDKIAHENKRFYDK
ncbi:MAG TPA: transcription antitermination factor NusB [Rickettsia endosymbiont of Diachasma alloeum]|nr:transcription antitermination factor NusB [Rickettsia endosymbiont of Diachasma alloeum]